jgi:type II secretory pathway pseudopilin PulG
VIELIVVIGTLALLLSLLFPVLSRVRASANVVACASNLRQIVMLMKVYSQSNDDRLPHQAIGLQDWSGTLTPLGKGQPVFCCPQDDSIRRIAFGASVTRSYGVNNGPFGNGSTPMRAPWPSQSGRLPAHLHLVPLRIFLIGDNGGQFTESAAWVGISEAEALDGIAWGTHRLKNRRGDNYGFSDGHVEYRIKQELDQWLVDADPNALGGPEDPWKWR